MSSLHLIIFLHGLWGHKRNLDYMVEQLEGKLSAGTICLNVDVNLGTNTYDGLDYCAERAFKQVKETIKNAQGNVEKISICSYSLGGLIARVLVGFLQANGVFETIEPWSFTTFASPHLGVNLHSTLLSRSAQFFAGQFMGRTGIQLYAQDDWRKMGRPLLEVMVEEEFAFMKGLKRFKHHQLYANATLDRVVPYQTAAIECEDPFADLEQMTLTRNEDYPALLQTWSRKSEPVKRTFWQQAAAYVPSSRRQKIFLVCLPVLLPIALVAFTIKGTYDTQKSYARIRRIELPPSDKEHDSSSWSERWQSLVQSMNQNMQESIVETGELGSPTAEQGEMLPGKDNALVRSAQPRDSVNQLKKKMIERLNTIPWTKHIVLIDKVPTSHPAIIVRDPSISWHRLGLSVIQHFIDHFPQ